MIKNDKIINWDLFFNDKLIHTWTKKYKAKAPAINGPILVGIMYNGIKHAAKKTETIIVILRPYNCETYPQIVPPNIAPIFAIIKIIDSWLGLSPSSLSRKVGYKSCVPMF